MEKKDELIGLLQERFTGHEVEVAPGTWEAISTQLAAGASAQGLREALQGKFDGHEVEVDPGVWQNISTQLGHGAAAGGATLGVGGWLAAGVAAVALTGGLLYWAAGDGPVATTVPAVPTERTVPAVTPAPAAPTVVAGTPAERTPAGTTAVPSAPIAPVKSQPTPAHTATPAASEATPLPADRTAEAGHAPADTPPASTPSGSDPGAAVVNSVLQQLVSQNATKPEPEHKETVPPPAAKDMPTDHIQPDAEQPAAVPNAAVLSEPNIFIPNVFSPNNDGVNDVLDVKGGPFREVRVRIISAKTNALVFSKNTLDEPWDGTVAGSRADEGYYFYAIEVVGEDGRTYSKGEVVRLFY